MIVRDLITHLSALNPDAEILPTWEDHCPGDFGGIERAKLKYARRFSSAPEVIWLLCDCEGPDPKWTVPPVDNPDPEDT